MRAHLRGQSSSLPAFGNRRSTTVEYATKRVTSDSRLAGEDGPESLMFGALGRIRKGYGPRSEREGRHRRTLPNLPRFALCSVAACALNRFRAFYPNSGQPNNSAPRKLVSLREHPWGSGGMCIDPFLKRLETVAHMLCHALWTRCKSLAWLSHLFFKELHVSVC